MSTYYDKKKLLEDSTDVYVSDYDKNLDYSYLSDIIDQKREYKKAADAGDEQGMKKANDRANSIRLQAGSYTSGTDGSKYNRVKRPYEANKPSYKKSAYKDEKDKIYRLISSKEDFKYDAEADPLYQTYKNVYLSLGNDAYKRALAQSSLRTGGVGSTAAISAASAAKNKYNSMLSAKIPELYEIAYSKHRDSLEDLYRQYELAESMDDKEYSRYRDDMSDYLKDREYYYDKDKEIADNLYGAYSDETKLSYDMSRDKTEDNYNQEKLSFEKQKHADDYNLDKQKHADEAELDRYEINEKSKNDKLSIAVNLAKALYGKVPVSRSTINTIISMLR